MTVTVTTISSAVLGNKRMVVGTYSDTDVSGNAGAGGEIPTGLITVEHFTLMKKGASVDSSANAVLNETLPSTTGTMTLIYDASVNEYWSAYGR